MRQVSQHLSQQRCIGPTSRISREIESRNAWLLDDLVNHRRELHAVVISRDVRQQLRDMLPRQFGKQLMLGRVTGFPFGNVDATAFQFLDIFAAEMLRSIAVTKYTRPISEGPDPFRTGLAFANALPLEIGRA